MLPQPSEYPPDVTGAQFQSHLERNRWASQGGGVGWGQLQILKPADVEAIDNEGPPVL